MKLEDIELNRISFEDERFRISYFYDLAKLKRSIAASGLLSPAVITPRNNSLVIVTGWKRVLACRELSFPTIPCFMLDESEDHKAFQLVILENAAVRDFNTLEMAMILKKLKSFGVEDEILLETHLPLFGIPQTLAHLDAHLAMAEFDDSTKEFIHTKQVSFPVIQHLTELKKEVRAALLPHLRHLGQNKQKELLEFLLEISKRENIPVLNVLATEAVAHVIHSKSLSPPQKADKIRILLREKRYPAYTAQEASFDTSLKKLEWPEDIAIEHSPFYEEEDISVRFTFKDSAEFKEKAQKLQKLASENKIEELLKSISDD
jgi:ParB family chromosome partitioning protein